jgi:hypothetical protein
MERKTRQETAKPFSIRLTAAEKSALLNRARGVPLGIYVRALVLDEQAPRESARRQYPVKDREAVAQALALLGRSGIAASLRQLELQAASGSLELDGRTRQHLVTACEELHAIRMLLMAGLGKDARKTDPPTELRASQAIAPDFARVAR